ncbi:hypothetical protein BGZ46_008310 [Entomortierella lignicola]|nr:hypothetical protein BGZ46_008310 [Entomortierella lignicola]
MPSADPVMQSISAPIPVPGTQQEPTIPPPPTLIDINTTNSASGLGNVSHIANNPRVSNLNHLHSNPAYGNNANSGLRRFPSIGGNKKLIVENTTLKAKVVELERYVTGLKEELILFTQKSHSLRSEINKIEERHAVEIQGLQEHIKACEFELGAKVVECDALHIQLRTKAIEQQELQQRYAQAYQEEQDRRDAEIKEQEKITSKAKASEQERDEKIKTLTNENTHKDFMINQLLEKVDRLGTEVLSLERAKAFLERPPSPSPTNSTVSLKDLNTNPITASASLKDLVPITAEAIIAATTPSPTIQNLASRSHVKRVPSSQSNSSLNTLTSTLPPDHSEDEDNVSTLDMKSSAFVNSVGYDISLEHSKLLAKFQALRTQHAQTSEYLEMLESENQELKVQLLDVNSGSDTVTTVY